MCFSLVEDPTHYTVIYPEGYYPNGVRVSKEHGKIVALKQILEAIEKHWKKSFTTGE